jgi:alpha-1,6-mannosyltransferase
VLVAVVACVVLSWPEASPVAVAPGGLPYGDTKWAWGFLAVLAVGFAAYLLALWLLRRGGRVRPVLALACAIQLAPLAAPLLLSTDAWTYWAYAQVGNPYVDTPAAAGSAAAYAGRDWLDQTSVYGPAFSLATEPLGGVDSSDVAAWTFKIATAAAVVAIAALAARRSRRPAFAAAFVGWNPVLAVHFAGGGHNDALMMALVAAALALGPLGRTRAAGAAWGLAVLVKWVALLLLPLRALEARATGRRVDHLGFAVTVVVVLALATVVYGGFDWATAFLALKDNATRETSYALPHRLGLPVWPFVLAFGAAYLWLLREAARGRARLGLALGLLLLALPYLIVWYVVWTVPLAAGDDDRPAQVLALALCAYLLPQTIPI